MVEPKSMSLLSGPLCRSRITIELPFVLLLPDGEYIGKIGKNKYTVGLELIAPKKESPGGEAVVMTLSGQVSTRADEGEIPGAGSRHTRAYIDFFVGLNRVNPSDAEFAHLRGLSRRFLNSFLDTFRVLFNDPKVYPLSPAEFFLVRFGYAPRWNLLTSDRQMRMGITFGDHPLQVEGISILQTAEVERFKEVLAKGPPQIVDTLLMDGSTHVARGDFRRAVVDVGSAIDICIEEVSLTLLARCGQLDEKKRDWLERVSPMEMMRKCVAPILGPTILDNPHWKAYEKDARPLRNKCVHDAYEPSNVEALSALSLGRALIHFLRQTST